MTDAGWTPLIGTDIRLSDADAPTLVAVWRETVQDLLDLGAGLSAEQWALPTDCPGWSVGDLMAHTAAIEGLLLGAQDPPHEPDWAALPHAASEFGRWAERPVDLRRSWPQEEVLAELSDVTARRAEALAAGPLRLDAEVTGIMGSATTLGRFLRVRSFDVWAHEQDARRALAAPGHLGSPGAWVSAGQLAGALPYVWGRGVRAPAGATLRVTATGPGVLMRQTVAVGPDGRAFRVADGAVPEPTVALTLTWPDLVRLGCGRVAGDDPAVRARVELSGDPELGDRLLPALAITP